MAGIREIDTKKLFEVKPKTKELLDLIAGKLHAIHADDADVADDSKLADVLERLFIENVFQLPKAAISPADFHDSFLTTAESAIGAVLALSGHPELVAASKFGTEATKWILNKFNRCGAGNRGEPAEGPKVDVKVEDGETIHVIRYFVEEETIGGVKQPILPPVEGSTKLARHLLSLAFDNWEIFLKLDVVRTGNLDDANLVVTSRRFGREVPDNYLALTDIGPPGGIAGGKPLQLRMVFDLGETFTRAAFVATAAHEFGHALGVKHADVPERRQLMNGTLDESIQHPGDFDLRAAERKGWRRS